MEVILNDGPDRMLYFFVSLVQVTEDENRSVSYGSVEILKPDIKATAGNVPPILGPVPRKAPFVA